MLVISSIYKQVAVHLREIPHPAHMAGNSELKPDTILVIRPRLDSQISKKVNRVSRFFGSMTRATKIKCEVYTAKLRDFYIKF